MNKKLLIVPVILLIIIVAFFVQKFLLSPGRSSIAALQINSVPRATVFINGKSAGQTPFSDDKMTEGEYLVKLSAGDEATKAAVWAGKVKLTSETLTFINRQLLDEQSEGAGEILWLERLPDKKRTELAVLSDPDNAGVKIDGQIKGSAPILIKNISSGDHEITIEAGGYIPRTLRTRAILGYKLVVNADLAKKVEEMKSLLTVTPTITSNLTPASKLTPTASLTKTISAPKVSAKPGEKTLIILETPTGWLNVRAEPKKGDNILTKIYPKEVYPMVEEADEWVKIRYQTDKEGWVSKQYLKISP